MTTSVFSKKYEAFRSLLTQYRRDKSITQIELAKKLKKPQSFVSKYESGERRLDVIEFLEICDALQVDSSEFIRKIKTQGR